MMNSALLNLSILHCHVLFTVAKHGNISKAAEELHMTQSTVTKIIKRVENVLHLILFERNNKGVSLTDDGSLLLGQWQDIFSQMDAILESVYQTKKKNQSLLSIALGSMLRGSTCFWPHIERLQKKYPDILLDISGGELWEIRQKLLDGHFDILVVPEFEKDICFDNHLQWCYVQTGLCAIHHNKNHKLKNNPPKSLADFKNETFLVADTDLIKGYPGYLFNACKQAGFTPKKIIKQQNQYMIEYFLKNDNAVLFGDEFFLMVDNMPDVVTTLIPNLHSNVIAIWNANNPNPAIAQFVSLFDDLNKC